MSTTPLEETPVCLTTSSRGSEIARILARIEAEYIGAARGLEGYAAVARHETITHRLEGVSRDYDRLAELVGGDRDKAMGIILGHLDEASWEGGTHATNQ
jgi:hypothetical protein